VLVGAVVQVAGEQARGKRIAVTIISSTRFSTISVRSACSIRLNCAWWFIQMIPIVRKLTT